MNDLPHDGSGLGRIHRRNNDKKFYCYFTGFLEGIAASGCVEVGEIDPLLAECNEFVAKVSDGDANDIIEDFKTEILEHETIESCVKMRMRDIGNACEKSQLNRFLGFCHGIVCDGIITLAEAESIVLFLSKQPELKEVVGVKQILVCCVDAIEDGVISPEESSDIPDAIGRIVADCYGDTSLAQTSGIANFEEAKLSDLDSDLENMSVVLTGSFQTVSRSDFSDKLTAFGAAISNSVTAKTDYVIVGGEASRDWIELNRGTRIIKAQKLRLKSDKPFFVSESQIRRLLAE